MAKGHRSPVSLYNGKGLEQDALLDTSSRNSAALIKRKEVIHYFSSELTEADYTRLNAVPGGTSFQPEYEVLAVVVALRCFTPMIRQLDVNRVILRGDNWVMAQEAQRR